MELSKSKNTYMTVFYFVFIFVLICHFLNTIINGYAKESWQITEFLINYQGGFVRRGLLGELIFQLYNYIGVSPYITILFISVSAYAVLILFFVKSYITNGYTLFILPFVFFLGNPIINNFYVRKDVLIILFFILIIYFSLKKSNSHLILVNLFFIGGLLIHESIAFFCFPILLLIFISKNNIAYKGRNTSLKSIIISIFSLLPSIFTFLCVSYYHGNQNTSKQIWNSWKTIIFPIQAENDNQIPAAIDGLSWSLKQAISFSVSTLKNFQDDIYGPIAWLLIILIIYYLLTNTDRLNLKILNYKPRKNFSKTTISNILIVQIITIIPLLIMGWDYGRYLFLWITSSFSIIILIPESKLSILFPNSLTTISTKINDTLDLLLSRSKGFLYLLCLIIGFSQYSWSLSSFIDKNSIFIVLQFISIGINQIFIFVEKFI